MRLPGFTAEVATCGRASFFHSRAPAGKRLSAGRVTTSATSKTCPPGSEMSGCPVGHRCAEPGDWPHCRCLVCFLGPPSPYPWPWGFGEGLIP